MIKVLLKAPLLTQSGYGHHSRTVMRALRTREDLFDIYLQPISWGQTSWLCEPDSEREWIDNSIRKTVEFLNSGGSFDASLQVTIPNEWETLAPVNIGITAGIETTKIAPQWIEKSYAVDKILTISQHSKTSFTDTTYSAKNNQTGEDIEFKCVRPVEYVSYPVLEHEPAEIDLELTSDFNFLSVVQISPRKNIDGLIKNFIENFRDDENVGLIVKANLAKNSLIDRNNTLMTLKNLVASYGERKCKIYLLHGRLTDQEMAAVYTNPKVKAMVSVTHGEGFGLPLFEAAYYGLPVIATDWSGHLDFLYKKTKQKNGKIKTKHMFERVTYTLAPVQKEAVWEGVIQADSMWAYPEDGSIKMALGEVYKDYGRFKKRAKELQKYVCKEFSAEKQYAEYVDQIYSAIPKPDEVSDDNWLNEIANVVKEYE